MDIWKLVPYKVGQISDRTDKIPEGIEMVRAPLLWRKGVKGKGVVVGVIDTGCDRTHPDLRGRIIGGRNFTDDFGGNIRNFSDGNGHGTHIAGTIAASFNNHGVAGVAPEAKLLILKALKNDGTGKFQDMIDAIHYAINWRGPQGERVRILSMSAGGKQNFPDMHQAVKKAVSSEILFVGAAGNSGDGKTRTSEKIYPGAYPEVVQVGAVTLQKELAEFTNTNDEIDLVAPGKDIISTYKDNKYAKLSGTSMAVPHVSGAAALIINQYESEGNTISEPELYDLLIRNTVPLGHGYRGEGHGLLSLDPVARDKNLRSIENGGFINRKALIRRR